MSDPMVNLITRDKWPTLTEEQIEAQILIRKDLVEKQLVGQFYPKVIKEEIEELESRSWRGSEEPDGN